MKIYNINQYNQNPPTFGAKVKVTGNTDTLPGHVVASIKANAKNIGRKDDLILFYFGKRQINILPSEEGDIIQQCRNVFAKSKINNHIMEKDLSYNIFNDSEEETKMIFDAVSEYLGNLRKYIKSKNK